MLTAMPARPAQTFQAFFKGLPEHVHRALLSAGRTQTYRSGNAITLNPSETLALLGGAIVCLIGSEHRDTLMMTEVLETGDCLYGSAETVSRLYRTRGLTEVLVLSQEQFMRLLTEHPVLCARVLTKLEARRRRMEQHIYELGTLEVRERVWRWIERLAVPNASGSGERSIRITHVELAEIVHACREAVSRCMSDFLREGRLEYHSEQRSRYILSDVPV